MELSKWDRNKTIYAPNTCQRWTNSNFIEKKNIFWSIDMSWLHLTQWNIYMIWSNHTTWVTVDYYGPQWPLKAKWAHSQNSSILTMAPVQPAKERDKSPLNSDYNTYTASSKKRDIKTLLILQAWSRNPNQMLLALASDSQLELMSLLSPLQKQLPSTCQTSAALKDEQELEVRNLSHVTW